MRRFQISVLFFSVIICMSCSQKPVEVLEIHTLKENESIEITLTSRGCFHHSVTQYFFHGASPDKCQITDQPQYSKDHVTYSGEIELTQENLKGLAAIIRFYKSDEFFGGSTTHNNIQIRYFREDELIGSEVLNDNSSIGSLAATYLYERTDSETKASFEEFFITEVDFIRNLYPLQLITHRLNDKLKHERSLSTQK